MTYDTIGDAVTMQGGAEGTLLAGRYRVVRQLGQGGMGSVWLAEDTQLDGKQFAIKMLPSVLVSNKRAYRQLKDEALVAMKLVHPNIVQLRAFEENNGNPFLVMDYIDGKPLDRCLYDWGKLSAGEVVSLLKPVAVALDYAHSQGVVHRDIKPGNIMVRKDGVPFLMDFGIAREIQETMTRVTGKLSSGTLLYMSPEQLNGDTPKKEQDIYSFAAMVYECMNGDPPFVRGAIEDQIKNKMPEPLVPVGYSSSETGEVAADRWGMTIASSVMAGLAKKPEDRPPTCAAVLEGNVSRGGAETQRAVANGNGRVERKVLAAIIFSALAVGGYFGWMKYDEGVKAREAARMAEAERKAAEEAETLRSAWEAAEHMRQETDTDLSIEQSIEKRMKEMMLPSIAFRPPATIVDAVDYFRQASKDYDRPDIPIDQRGFNFILTLNKRKKPTGGGDAPAVDNNAKAAFGTAADENMSDYDVPQIPNIVLSNISLWEALYHVCRQIGFMFEIQGSVVMVMPKNMTTDESEKELAIPNPSKTELDFKETSQTRETVADRQGGGSQNGIERQKTSVDNKKVETEKAKPRGSEVKGAVVKPAAAEQPIATEVQRIKPMVSSRRPGNIGEQTSGGMRFGDPLTEATVMKVLWWLKASQGKDGSWEGGSSRLANTSFALLTYLAHGDYPGSESSLSNDFGPVVQSAINYLNSCIYVDPKAGGIVKMKGSDGHEYAFLVATYAICEAYGMTRDPKCKETATRCLERIINGQSPTGGWDYNINPKSHRDDLSFAGWALQALYAGKMAGLQPDGLDTCIKKAIRCLQVRNFHRDHFTYCASSRQHPGLTGTGCLALQLLGYGASKEVSLSLDYMKQWKPTFEASEMGVGKDCPSPQYYCYYVTQCKYQAGMRKSAKKSDEALWKEWNKLMKQTYPSLITELPTKVKDSLGRDHKQGYFQNKDMFSSRPVMDTCLVALQLMVYYRYPVAAR